MKLGRRRKYHEGRNGRLLDTMQTNPPVPYDFCVGVPMSRLLTIQHSVFVLNVKAVVAAFNQEKALVGAFP